MTDDESPVVKVVNAVLLVMIKKGARKLELRRDGAAGLVELDNQVEMRPPDKLVEPMRRRFGVMASLPYRRKGEVATGTITLLIGGKDTHHFGVEIDDVAIRVTRLDAAPVPN